MPEPDSTYQAGRARIGSSPARRHSSASFRWVPDSSPREMKGDSVAAILARAAARSATARTPAGSSPGPATTNWFRITGPCSVPYPSAMKRASPVGSWVSSRSASPRRPISRAAPEPTAVTERR